IRCRTDSVDIAGTGVTQPKAVTAGSRREVALTPGTWCSHVPTAAAGRRQVRPESGGVQRRLREAAGAGMVVEIFSSLPADQIQLFDTESASAHQHTVGVAKPLSHAPKREIGRT
ncbi:hypothetical protein ILYODFUR_032756, partial [Ilyodon furcidens]